MNLKEKIIYDFYITPEEYDDAKLFGVSPTLLEQRIRNLAWDKERAITTTPHKKHSLKEWVYLAEQNGICYSTLRYRVNRLGWDAERAATQPLQDRKKHAEHARESGRVYPKEIIALLEKNGVPYDNFRRRVKAGWDIIEAATRPTMTPREIGLLTKDKRSKGLKIFFNNRQKVRSKSQEVVVCDNLTYSERS